MTLHAGGARQLLDKDVEAAREALLGIEGMGRQALEEMHRLVRVLRESHDDGHRTPPASIDQLSLLANQTRTTGLDVEVDMQGERRQVAAGLEASVYRIVQEALTNITKHSNATVARVSVSYREDAVEVTVSDNGTAVRVDAIGSGHGLVGMRERVSIFGGSFDAGPKPEAGWEVKAVLPTGAKR